MPPDTSPVSKKVDRKTLGVGVVGALIGLVVGLILGQNLPGFNSPKPSSETSQNAVVNQSATAQGKIVSVGGGKIVLESDSGERSEFPLSQNINLYVYKDRTSPASASADLTVLELNRQVLVSLGVVNGAYQATTITVLPPPVQE